MWLSLKEVIMVEKSLSLVASLMHLFILIMSLSLREVMMEVMMEAIMGVIQASVVSSMDLVFPMMWVIAKEKLTLRPAGGNSKLQAMATAATHGNGNGKLRINYSSWPKVELLGRGSFGRMYKVITHMYSGGNSMLDPSAIAKIYDNGKLKIYNFWQKVELLGHGSFGIVYRAITLCYVHFSVIMMIIQTHIWAIVTMIIHIISVITRQRLTLRVGRNSKVEPGTISTTNENQKSKIYESSWEKVKLLGNECYTCLSKMMMIIPTQLQTTSIMILTKIIYIMPVMPVTTKQMGENSKRQHSAITKTLDNGKLKIHDNSWEKVKLVGSGSFGWVYEAITYDGRFFAVKEVLLTDQGRAGQQSIDQLQQEISLLSQFRHKHIVQYYGSFKDKTKLCIFLELATEGSLLNLYQKHKLSDFQASEYTRQIVKGLKYLHEHNIVHRDIKCANILVHVNGTVKLADFGLAKLCKLNDIKSCKGTAFWMAPEVVNKKKRKNNGYGFAADIWSLGCTVLEMLTQRHPYPELEPESAVYQIGRGQLPNVPDFLMTDARYFICECLRVDPNDRPTAAQLLEHSFVRRQSQR